MIAVLGRQVPDPEWVGWYRKGVPASSIAAAAGAAPSTVRYHLQIAARRDPLLREKHRKAAPIPPRKETERGAQNLRDILALYRQEQRLPRGKSSSARERALAVWLMRRRQEAHQGTLLPEYRDLLQEIPGWDAPPRQKEEREALWNRRFTDLVEYRRAGNDWPLHKKTSSEQERLLGVWLHSQRITARHGTLRQNREARLNAQLPGWRKGRPPGRRAQAGPDYLTGAPTHF